MLQSNLDVVTSAYKDMLPDQKDRRTFLPQPRDDD